MTMVVLSLVCLACLGAAVLSLVMARRGFDALRDDAYHLVGELDRAIEEAEELSRHLEHDV